MVIINKVKFPTVMAEVRRRKTVMFREALLLSKNPLLRKNPLSKNPLLRKSMKKTSQSKEMQQILNQK